MAGGPAHLHVLIQCRAVQQQLPGLQEAWGREGRLLQLWPTVAARRIRPIVTVATVRVGHRMPACWASCRQGLTSTSCCQNSGSASGVSAATAAAPAASCAPPAASVSAPAASAAAAACSSPPLPAAATSMPTFSSACTATSGSTSGICAKAVRVPPQGLCRMPNINSRSSSRSAPRLPARLGRHRRCHRRLELRQAEPLSQGLRGVELQVHLAAALQRDGMAHLRA